MKYIYLLISFVLLITACSKSDENISLGSGQPGSGQGGSLARFTIAAQHLYVVDHQNLYTYSLHNSYEPQLVNTTQIGFDIETIYPYKDKLFIGSREAMYIYSIQNPGNPVRKAQASHVRACDPVVADDHTAYVTVRSGTDCGGIVNALIVYDISDFYSPSEVNQITLKNPYGLGMKDDLLYVCDGGDGLKVYDISDRKNPVIQYIVKNETFFDVIPTDDLLICMVEGGTVFYEYGNNGTLSFAAKLVD